MKNNIEQPDSLLSIIDGIIWQADADLQQFYFVSNQLKHILDDVPDDRQAQKNYWLTHIHPDDRNIVDIYRQLSRQVGLKKTFTYRLLYPGNRVLQIRDTVTVTQQSTGEIMLLGFMQDISLTVRLQAMEQLEHRILALHCDPEVPLQKVLMAYLEGLEQLFPQMYCSVHLIKNNRLGEGIAPSLPQAYLSTFIDIPIGENQGSCGAAAATKQQVIVSNIARDHRWENCKDVALSNGLHACWSNPVISTLGTVMATVAMYYREIKQPVQEELDAMEKVTALLRVILEHRQQTEIIRESNLLMQQSQELAGFGNWRWDVQADVVTWSPVLYNIYGLDREKFKATFAGYQDLLHPEDRETIYAIITAVLQTGKDASFEERIIRPDGQIRFLRSWAKLKSDAQGKPLEMIGACLDITTSVLQKKAIEQQNQQLLDVAWMQSHMVRSPLARMMMLLELLQSQQVLNEEHQQLLSYLKTSAQELDEQLHIISKKTEMLHKENPSEE